MNPTVPKDTKHIVFLDYENQANTYSALIDNSGNIRIPNVFVLVCGSHFTAQKNWSAITSPYFQYIERKSYKKNSADFVLVYYLAQLDMSVSKSVSFVIVSNDSDFEEAVIQTLQRGRYCVRINAVELTTYFKELPLLLVQAQLEDTTDVWCTAHGKKYHADKHCQQIQSSDILVHLNYFVVKHWSGVYPCKHCTKSSLLSIGNPQLLEVKESAPTSAPIPTSTNQSASNNEYKKHIDEFSTLVGTEKANPERLVYAGPRGGYFTKTETGKFYMKKRHINFYPEFQNMICPICSIPLRNVQVYKSHLEYHKY